MGRKVCFEGRNLWGGIASFFQLVGTYIDQDGIHGNLRRDLNGGPAFDVVSIVRSNGRTSESLVWRYFVDIFASTPRRY